MTDARDLEAPLVDQIAWLLSEHYSSRPGCACARQGSVEYTEHVAGMILTLIDRYIMAALRVGCHERSKSPFP